MARKNKFPLKMANDIEVRSLDELRQHFDINKIVEYFRDGKLLEWLSDRYYDDEAEAINKLDKDDHNFGQKLCNIFGVDYDEAVDPEFAKRVKQKRSILSTKTKDKNILSKAKIIALTQEDLADLLDLDVPVIYLCGDSFNVPIRIANKKYIGILGSPKIIINATSQNDLKAKNITFENCILPFKPKIDTTKINKPSNEQKIISNGGIAEVLTVIKNKGGIHARPASIFVQTACKFKSKIQIKAKGKTIGAKSILMIMSLGLVKGTQISIIADGSDSVQAVTELKALIDNKFYEE